MPSIIKKIIISLVILTIIGIGVFIGLRPWWLGFETINKVGMIKNTSFVERPLCKYYQGDFFFEETGQPLGSFRFWIDKSNQELFDKVETAVKSGMRVELTYQKDRANRFWACTPSEYKVVAIVPIAHPPSPVTTTTIVTPVQTKPITPPVTAPIAPIPTEKTTPTTSSDNPI